jgi:hypothetical protein
MRIRTIRLLNERPGWLGLSFWDIAGVGYFLLFSHAVCESVGLPLLSFVLTAFLFLGLLKIRLSSRPKTIRDFLRSKLLIKPFTFKRSK